MPPGFHGAVGEPNGYRKVPCLALMYFWKWKGEGVGESLHYDPGLFKKERLFLSTREKGWTEQTDPVPAQINLNRSHRRQDALKTCPDLWPASVFSQASAEITFTPYSRQMQLWPMTRSTSCPCRTSMLRRWPWTRCSVTATNPGGLEDASWVSSKRWRETFAILPRSVVYWVSMRYSLQSDVCDALKSCGTFRFTQ